MPIISLSNLYEELFFLFGEALVLDMGFIHDAIETVWMRFIIAEWIFVCRKRDMLSSQKSYGTLKLKTYFPPLTDTVETFIFGDLKN